jgi:hypothetical protein
MSLDSLVAAGVGITAATPLVLFRAWSWTPQAAQVFPAFEDMHMGQVRHGNTAVAFQAPSLALRRDGTPLY